MRTIARATAAAVLAAVAGCALVIGPRDGTTDDDMPRPVWASLHNAIDPAVGRSLCGPDWVPDFCERGCGGGGLTVLGREQVERKYVYCFRCVREAAGAGVTGRAWLLAEKEYPRILEAINADLLTALTHCECEVTHRKLTASAIEIDYKRGDDAGTIRARIGPEAAPEGITSEYTRFEIDVSERIKHRLGVSARGPLISLLGRALD